MGNKPVIGITADSDEKYLRVKHGYCEAVAEAGGIPVLLPHVDNPKDYAEIINALLISGGDDLDPSYYNEEQLLQVKPVSRKRSDFEFSLLSEMIGLKKPVFGICYGMQLINVFFGGTLYQDIGTQLSVETDHKKDYHLIVITKNRFLKEDRFYVNSTHHQAIKKLGNGLLPVAYSQDGLIEAFSREDYNFLIGVQWHPERLAGEELSLNLFKSFIEVSCDGK